MVSSRSHRFIVIACVLILAIPIALSMGRACTMLRRSKGTAKSTPSYSIESVSGDVLTDAQIDRIGQLRSMCFGSDNRSSIVGADRMWFLAKPRRSFFSPKRDTIAGCCQVVRKGKTLYFYSMCVDVAHRGKRLGMALHRRREAYCRATHPDLSIRIQIAPQAAAIRNAKRFLEELHPKRREKYMVTWLNE